MINPFSASNKPQDIIITCYKYGYITDALNIALISNASMSGIFKSRGCCNVFLCLVLLTCFDVSFAKETRNDLVIIYPSSTNFSIYKEIIKGVKTSQLHKVKKVLELKIDNRNEIKQWIKNNQPISIVAIGNEVSELGVSFSLQEKTIKKKLQKYLPHIQKIYRTENGKNLIYSSKDDKSLPIFVSKVITKEDESIKYLWEKINSIDPEKEAVWINNDIDLEFLRYLSEKAWERNVILLSNNIRHLEIGILFAFFPDFEALGERVAKVIDLPPSASLLESLKVIKLGVNTRTAKHLGVTDNFSENDFILIIR